MDISKFRIPGIRHIAALGFYGYKFKEFLLVSEDPESYKFYHIPTGKCISISR